MVIFFIILQENYINYRPSSAGRDEVKRLSLIARAAESISDGDIFNVQIRRNQQWQLSQSSSLASCIIPYVPVVKYVQNSLHDFHLAKWPYLILFNQCCTDAWTKGDTWAGKGRQSWRLRLLLALLNWFYDLFYLSHSIDWRRVILCRKCHYIFRDIFVAFLLM